MVIWDADVTLPAKFIYLFHDAVIGMPKVADFLESNLDVVSWDTIALENSSLIPKHSWVEVEKNIYPINIPEAKFDEDLDLILIDCPSRNLSMMPNGLGMFTML